MSWYDLRKNHDQVADHLQPLLPPDPMDPLNIEVRQVAWDEAVRTMLPRARVSLGKGMQVGR